METAALLRAAGDRSGRAPESHPWLDPAERDYITSGRAASSEGGWRPGWGELLRYRQTLPSDFFPKSAVASVAGLGGTAAAAASILYNWNTARVVDAFGYTPVFVTAGLLGPAGLVASCCWRDESRRCDHHFRLRPHSHQPSTVGYSARGVGSGAKCRKTRDFSGIQAGKGGCMTGHGLTSFRQSQETRQ